MKKQQKQQKQIIYFILVVGTLFFLSLCFLFFTSLFVTQDNFNQIISQEINIAQVVKGEYDFTSGYEDVYNNLPEYIDLEIVGSEIIKINKDSILVKAFLLKNKEITLEEKLVHITADTSFLETVHPVDYPELKSYRPLTFERGVDMLKMGDNITVEFAGDILLGMDMEEYTAILIQKHINVPSGQYDALYSL